MPKPADQKIHYKMYKKGRFWIIAGIAALSWQAETLAVQADATNTTSEDSTGITNTANDTNAKTAVLASSTSAAATSSDAATSTTANSTTDSQAITQTKTTSTAAAVTSTATSENTSTSTNAASADSATVTSAESTASVATSAVTSADSSITTSAENTTSTAASEATSANSAIDASSDSTVTETVDSSANTTTATADSTVTADSADSSVSANTATSAATDMATSDSATKTTLPTQAKALKSSATTKATTIDYSGTFNAGASWTLDSDGVLTINEGGMDASTSTSSSLWAQYFDVTLVKKVIINGTVKANSQSVSLFSGMTNLTTFENGSNFDVSNVTSMSRMFFKDSALVSIDVSNWDTSNVTDMSDLFQDNSSLTSLDVSNWNTSKVTSMNYLFRNVSSVTTLDVSKWNTDSTITMLAVFYGTTNLTNLDLSGWNTSQVNNISYMFYQSGVTNITGIGQWDTANVTTMANMFSSAINLTTVDVSKWNTSKVTDMSYMFKNTTDLTALNVSNWDVNNVTTMFHMFDTATSLTTLDVSKWNTSKVTDMSYMFYLTSSLTSLDLSQWNTSNVTTMSYTFYRSGVTDIVGISNWDTSNVTDMSYMFGRMTKIISLSIGNWNTSSVTNMSNMFFQNTSLTSLNLANWDTSNVTNMSGMFSNATRLQSLNISNFTISDTTNIVDMLAKTTKLNKLVLGANVKLTNSTGSVNLQPVTTTKPYTGNWIKDGDYTTYQSSDDLMKNYDGSAPGTYTWQISYVDITLTSDTETIIAGDNWSAETNFASATNVDGSTVNFKDITVTYQKDGQPVEGITTAGAYVVTYSFNDSLGNPQSKTITVTVAENKVSIVAKPDSSIVAGSTWNSADNFASAADTDGTVLTVADMKITYTKDGQPVDQLDTKSAGTYVVTYSFIDQQGNYQSAASTIIVTNDAGLTLKNPTEIIIAGDKWSAETNFDSATNVDGSNVDFSKVTVTYKKDGQTVSGITTAGSYEVTYSFSDSLGKTQEITSTVTVNENKVSIVAKPDSSIVAGSTWNSADNLVSATDTDGTVLTVADMKITYTKDGKDVPSINPKEAGSYTITYSFTDKQGNLQSATSTLTITNDASISVKNPTETIIAGDNWSAETNFDSATNVDGSNVNFSDVTVTYTKNGQPVSGITTAGTYEVTYSFTDSLGNNQSTTSMVTVAENQVNITVKPDDSIVAGSTWKPADNFASATDTDGSVLTVSDMEMTYTKNGKTVDSINPNEAGVYTITYSFTDKQGRLQSATSTLTITNEAGLILKQPTESIIAGDNWSAETNFASAANVDGSSVNFKDITVAYQKDGQAVSGITTAGTYTVTYSFTDSLGNRQSTTSTVIVAKNQVSITAKPDSSIVAGTDWSKANSFDTAHDVDGSVVALKDLTVTYTKNGQPVAQLDTKSAGTYVVTYSFIDQQGNRQSASSTVIVTNAADLQLVTDTETMVAGDTWLAENNFNTATNVDGSAVDFANVTVTYTKNGQPVNGITTAGTYQVTYSFVDTLGHRQTKTSTLIVTRNQVNIVAKPGTTIVAGSTWSAQDNFGFATDVDGTDITLKDLTVTYMKDGHSVTQLDPNVAGTYVITYSFTDQRGQLQQAKSTVIITNDASLQLTNKTETIIAGDNWSAKNNFKSATNIDGSTVAFANITVTYLRNGQSVAGITTVGTYQVTYSFIDTLGNRQTQTSTVTVVNSQSQLKVKPTTDLTTGETWHPVDNLITAKNTDGTNVAFRQLTVTIKNQATNQLVTAIDTSKAGSYLVTYYFIDQQGLRQTAQSIITVLAEDDQADLIVTPDTDNSVDDSWHAEDDFVSGTDSDGTDVSYDKVKVSVTKNGQPVTQVNRHSAGTYQVTYQFMTKNGHLQSATRTITINAKSGHGSQNTESTLPQTDEATSASTVTLGAILLALTGLITGFGRIKHKRQD
ncbi:hypothetical protein C5Z26_06720 [Lactobacillus sp. CBA3606]|uniref:bacterial Ig-like domain-containing protein n=1 Tax=Lactobacillus sp. CBA3606 TaxID=2099789 RepID=UPI000CFDA00A|nr:bacterial Ig-like domain-containing protein [Lactobacillus sp. CBA3606]AVK63819.1 hypothetical protein C5Z26_06720 [Lactobacillus sp. CBA3606]